MKVHKIWRKKAIFIGFIFFISLWDSINFMKKRLRNYTFLIRHKNYIFIHLTRFAHAGTILKLKKKKLPINKHEE